MVIPYVKGDSFAMGFLKTDTTTIIDKHKLLDLLLVNNWCKRRHSGSHQGRNG